MSENDAIAFTAGSCASATYMAVTRIHNEYGVQTSVFAETGLDLHVCSRFGGLEATMQEGSVNVREVRAVTVRELPLDLVAKLPLDGVGLTTADKVCLMNSESACSLCVDEAFSNRVFAVQGEESFFAMVHMTTMATVRVCYKYASYEHFVTIGSEELTVVAPALNYIYPSRIVGNVESTITFNGRFLGGEVLTGAV